MRQIDRVDPELRPNLPSAEEAGPPVSRQSLAEVRRESERRNDEKPAFGTTIPRVSSVPTQGGPLNLYVFKAKQSAKPMPCLLWFHGGGYIMGRGRDMWHGPLLAERAGCVVISVDYRLAPEHPHPAGIEDAFSALKWVHENAHELNIDPSRIAVGGASAGGGLAAGLALYNRDHENLPLAFQLLLYPMIDNLHDTPSGRLADHPSWRRSDSLAAWEMYLGGELGAKASPYAAPSRATDHSGLPPAYLCVGEVDLFLDENIEYANRLNGSKVTCEIRTYAGVYHGAEGAGAATKIGKAIIDDYVAALLNAFG